jgi:putative colanic acid biosynthesis UDP-glucose lipid carrier transferase
MRGASTAELPTASGTAIALEAAAKTFPRDRSPLGGKTFARDGLAGLSVGLYVADALVISGTGIVLHLIRNGWVNLPPPHRAHIAVGCLLFGNIMLVAGMYRFAALRNHHKHLTRVTEYWVAVLLILIAIIYLGKLSDEFSRIWMFSWAVSGWLGLSGNRVLTWRAMRWLHERGQLVTRIAIVGEVVAAERYAQRLHENSDGDVQVFGIFEMRDVPSSAGGSERRDIDDLARLTADMRVDEIVVVVSFTEVAELGSTLGKLSTLAVDIKLWVEFDVVSSLGYGYLPSILISVWERPLAGLPSVFKRGMDITGSTIILALTLPLLGLIAALIKLDSPGPVLFRQQRFGFSKRPFILYKLRSMYSEGADEGSVPQARRHDPRVTRIGRLLRRTSLDELPQLANVLKGDMSLVGPRPHAIAHDEKYARLVDGYFARHRVKPGITGWAQVNGLRGETDTLEKMERRIELDRYYIDNWSPLLDFKILGRTLAAVLHQRNAY